MGLELLGYPASFIMGLALGLTGGGGSILTVPIFVYLFGIGALQATAYSLAVVGLVALWGAREAYQKGDLNLNRALSFGIPGVLGVLVSRRLLLPSLPNELSIFGARISQNSILLIAFAGLMLAASISMLRSSVGTPRVQREGIASVPALILGGFAVGLLAGFVGAGGGFIIVPALVSIGRLDMRHAIGTSLFVIALQSLLGVLGDFKALVQMDLFLFVSVVMLALVGMTVGARLRQKLSQKKLKMGFAVFVFVMGNAILFQELRRGIL